MRTIGLVIAAAALLAGCAQKRPEQKVPALPQVREIVTSDLRLLAKAIQKNDFGDYLANASLTYRSQYTNEKLKTAFQELVDAKLDLEKFMDGEFALTGAPSLSQEGVLVVQGRYPAAQGAALVFRGSYVFDQAGWKPFGMQLQFATE